MFRHTKRLQFEAKPEKPDPVYARKLQELIGGAFGEMSVTMQYLFQGWNCRMEGKYKDLLMDTRPRRSVTWRCSPRWWQDCWKALGRR
jgi:Mn-containing catalase